MFSERNTFRDINLMAEEAKRRAEIARLVRLLLEHTTMHICVKRISMPVTCLKDRELNFDGHHKSLR
jgi:hypothetical protein